MAISECGSADTSKLAGNPFTELIRINKVTGDRLFCCWRYHFFESTSFIASTSKSLSACIFSACCSRTQALLSACFVDLQARILAAQIIKSPQLTADVVHLCASFMLLNGLDNLFFAVAFFHFELSIVPSLLEISSISWCYFLGKKIEITLPKGVLGGSGDSV